MHHTPRVWPWCYPRQPRGHSLNGKHTDQEFLRPPSRPRNRRSAWMLSCVMPEQMTIMRMWKKSSIADCLLTFKSAQDDTLPSWWETSVLRLAATTDHGTAGVGRDEDNGERFPDLCALTNLVIKGSVFQHKRIHKATCILPGMPTENQIGHVCIGRKFRSLQDVCVERGADVASDHHLLITKLKLKLKRNWTGDSCLHPQYDTTMLLKNTT